jgi:hypothetical protein
MYRAAKVAIIAETIYGRLYEQQIAFKRRLRLEPKIGLIFLLKTWYSYGVVETDN